MGCMVCGGEPMYLGPLGNHTWLRCRDCGIEWFIKTPACFVPTMAAEQEAWDYWVEEEDDSL